MVALLPHRGLVWSLPLRVLGCALPQNTPSALLPRPAPRARRPPRALQTAAVVYMTTKMVMTRGVSVMLYIGYMLVASFTFFMFTFFMVFTFMSMAPCMIVRSSSLRSPARNACEDAVAATDARRRVADRARAAA